MKSSEFKIRRAIADDVEYIIKTWSREVHAAQPKRPNGASWWPGRLFYDQYQADVILPLSRKCECRVAYPTDEPTLIAGFVVAQCMPAVSTCVVHFAFVRPAFRRLGLAQACLEDIGYQAGFELIATEWTKYMNRFERPDLQLNRLALYQVANGT